MWSILRAGDSRPVSLEISMRALLKDELLPDIKEMYFSKLMTCSEIGEVYGVTASVMKYFFRKHQIKLRSKKLSKHRMKLDSFGVDKIKIMYVDQGKKCTEIAKLIGVNPDRVSEFLKKNKIKVFMTNTIQKDDPKKIINLYVNHQYSLSETSKKTGVAIGTIRKVLSESGHKIRNLKQACGSISNRMRLKQKNILNDGMTRTEISRKIRMLPGYKTWRFSVFQRDNFTCQNCKRKDVCLNADHIKPFSKIMREKKVKSVLESLKCQELWDISNGRTLCVPCHIDTETYGNRRAIFVRPVELISLNGKSCSKKFKRMTDAVRKYNLHHEHIVMVCQGKMKHTKGHVFKYSTDERVRVTK